MADPIELNLAYSRSDYASCRVQFDTFAIIVEHDGEGYNGPYSPDDTSDEPLLRFSVFERNYMGGWEQVQDSSYCTRIVASTSDPTVATKLARYLYRALRNHLTHKRPVKSLCQNLSWILVDDL